jgi:hypothetical protein
MALIKHFDRQTWTILPSPNPTNGQFRSNGLFAGVVPWPTSV